MGNKNDLEADPHIPRESLEATVTFDWENGYVESSAKERRNINKIFKELLVQARSRYDFGSKLTPKQGSLKSNSGGALPSVKPVGEAMRRRQSLPAVPVGFLSGAAAASHLVSVGEEDELPAPSKRDNGSCGPSFSNVISKMRPSSHDQEDDIFAPEEQILEFPARKKSAKRRSSLTALRKDSCKVA